MAKDPITLIIALDREGSAVGELYVDDGSSYAFQVSQHPVSTESAASLAGRERGSSLAGRQGM